jgi:hypothetical protein
MDVLFLIVGLLGFIVTIVMLVIKLIKKRPLKLTVIMLFFFLIMFFIGASLLPPASEENIVADDQDELAEEEQASQDEIEPAVEEDTQTAEQIVEAPEPEVSAPVETAPEKTEEEILAQKKQDQIAARKAELERIFKNRLNEGDYYDTTLREIKINEDLGHEGPTTRYIALVYLNFTINNTRSTANDVMRLYSDDLVATVAAKGVRDISEAAVFWNDSYNNRSLKYAYVFSNNSFYLDDVMGE